MGMTFHRLGTKNELVTIFMHMRQLIVRNRRFLSILMIFSLGLFVSSPQAKWYCQDGVPCSATCTHPTRPQSTPMHTAMVMPKGCCCPMCDPMTVADLNSIANIGISSGFCHEVISHAPQIVNPASPQLHSLQIALNHGESVISDTNFKPIFDIQGLDPYESPPHELSISRAPPAHC